MKWYQMYCQLILLLIKISACTVYFGLWECILSIPHLEHVLLLQKKRRKTIWSECRIVSPFKCKACEPPPNLRSALLDTLKNECFSITKMLNSKKCLTAIISILITEYCGAFSSIMLKLIKWSKMWNFFLWLPFFTFT